MKSVLAIIAWVCLLPGFPASADDARPADSTLPECTEKVELMPDLCQTDEAFRSLPYQGKYSCGAVAVANVLVALDRRGFDRLIEGDVGSKAVQCTLLAELSAKPYLETTRHGIGPIGIMNGLERFVEARGYHARFEWTGWRHGGDYATARFVNLDWLREGASGESNVVLNVGWYRRDEEQDLYVRVGGHYMTLVGYRRQGDDFTYLIHDPAARSGPGKVTHEARLVPIPGGRLAPWKSYAQRSAEGHFLIEGIVVKSTADAAILDGAIRVTIGQGE